MKYTAPKFTVPATNPTKRPCKIHHFVKGQCLRCPQKLVQRVEITEAGKAALKESE